MMVKIPMVIPNKESMVLSLFCLSASAANLKLSPISLNMIIIVYKTKDT
jgi:hypothetical protein